MPNTTGLLRHPLVTVAVGASVMVADGAAATYRTAVRLPVVGARLDRGVTALARRGEDVIGAGLDPVRALVGAVVLVVVRDVLARLDLTDVVRQQVDVNAIARDIDIDAIIARIDLVGLADVVIDGVDLPTIIRQSTSSVTAEVMSDVRSHGERADDMVAGIVDRMLGRRGGAPGPAT